MIGSARIRNKVEKRMRKLKNPKILSILLLPDLGNFEIPYKHRTGVSTPIRYKGDSSAEMFFRK